MNGRSLLVLVFPALVALGSVHADPDDAAHQVEQGLGHFRAGQFTEAQEKFAAARQSAPDNAHIAFNLGCAAIEAGRLDDAIAPLQQAALTSDPELALAARYNLGGIALRQALAAVGAQPENAAPPARQTALDALKRALAHFRDVAAVGRDHPRAEDARYNIELIRSWIHQMKEAWAERDRTQEQQQTNLVQMIMKLYHQQRELRHATQSARSNADASTRRAEWTRVGREQTALAGTLPALREKIQQELSAAPSQPGLEQARTTLLQRADAVAKAMAAATAGLEAAKPEDAIAAQTEVLSHLNQLFVMVVPFPDLVQEGVKTEQSVVDATIPVVEQGQPSSADTQGILVEDQSRLAGWSRVLPAKAEALVKALDQQATTPSPTGSPAPGAPPPQTEALRAAAARAIELSPQIRDQSDQAVTSLRQGDLTAALPREEEALRLWREIAELLPKQESSDRQQQDQQQQDPQGQDQQQQDQEQQDQQAQDPKSQEHQAQDQQKKDATDGKDARPQGLSKTEAEALMRQAQERERKYREAKRQIEAEFLDPVPVEKDW